MTGIYNSWLVALSAVIAFIASYASLEVVSASYGARRGRVGMARLAGSALTMGTGIWSMHFVGMLAFSLPIPLSYDIPLTLASWGSAVAAMAAALWLPMRFRHDGRVIFLAGALMGGGISVMHYLGMAAILVQPAIDFDPVRVALSVAIAIGAAIAALAMIVHRAEGRATLRSRLVGAAVMAAAVVVMHYVAMAAARFAPDSICSEGSGALDNGMLALSVGILAVLCMLAATIATRYAARTPTIRSSLGLLVFACVLPAVLLLIAAIVFEYERASEQIAHDSVTTARALSLAIDRDLATVESTLRTLAAFPSAETRDLRAWHRQASLALAHLNAKNIYVAEADGRQVLNTLLPFGAPLPKTGNVGMVSDVMARGDTVISGMFTGAVSGRPVVAVGVPVVRDGRAVEVLGATLSPERLAALLGSQRLPPNWIVAIHDRSKRFIARTHDMERFLGQSPSTDLGREMSRRGEGTLEGTTRDGVRVIAAFTQSPVSGWTVSIGIPKRELTGKLYRSMAIAVAASVALLGSGLFLATLLANRIGRSIRSLQAPAAALSRAEEVVVPPSNLEEVDEVGRALEKTSEILFRTRYQAQHDPLTGLANRSLMREIVRQQVRLGERTGTTLAVLYIDLDGFKPVNDTWGHQAGDDVLRTVAARIAGVVRTSDLAVRLGGDEFAVVLMHAGRDGAENTAYRLLDELSQPIPIDGGSVALSASIGIALHPHAGSDVESLLQRADEAMYVAKKSGKARFSVA